jgi:thiol-disulfide isomerase/thioredoxin
MPVLEKLHKELAPKGFEVIAVNLDYRVEDALRFLRRYPVSYPVLRDTGTLPELYELEVMPTSYLIDRKGIIRHIHYGYRKGDEAILRRAFLQLLEESDG